MVISSILRHLFNDDESLSGYLQGQFASFEDIRRRVFLKERSENRTIPDHHYRLVLDKGFKNLHNKEDILSVGIYQLAKEHLELRNNRIHVKQEKLNEWQLLITYMPPLVLQAAFLSFEKPITGLDNENILGYYKNYIFPNSKYTALPYPFIPQLESYIRDKNGLHDLHMHLNGSLETDLVWQDFLSTPEDIYHELYEGFKNPKVKEQLEQESHLLHPSQFRHLLIFARRMRYIFYDFIFNINSNIYEGFCRESLLINITAEPGNSDINESFRHPFQGLISTYDKYDHPMAIEGLMYMLVVRYLNKRPSNVIADLFHFYLLILGLANRLLVQQTHQHGFEQFQKHTLNGLREFSEENYLRRFFQLHGNEMRNIAFLEGRISPKESTNRNIETLKAIDLGWKKMLDSIINAQSYEKFEQPILPIPQLRLIVHFIKKEDKSYQNIRHKTLRLDIWKRAKVLALMLKNQPDVQRKITGIDAAASEFDTPPEVFAPVFRMMRRKGIRHFTYHAGEDFHHIISGLRAVFEAVIFTEMQQGDRIGHAVATGISVKQWVSAIGKQILIARGEWLDNLIFTYHLIVSKHIEELYGHLPSIVNTIGSLAHLIYGKYFMPGQLEDAWQLRQYCPILVFCERQVDARRQDVYEDEEWFDIQKRCIKDDSKEILLTYHDQVCRKKYEEPIEINVLDIFGEAGIQALQLATLKILHHKEIVIETLPTSNVRIGHHRDFSTYHLWNWFKWEDEGHSIPPIVVGSDDTGIFATSIFNEYANIYCHLTSSGRMTHNKAMQIIERLDKNSRIYRFE